MTTVTVIFLAKIWMKHIQTHKLNDSFLTHHSSNTHFFHSKSHQLKTLVMFLWTKQNPKSLAVKCHKWFCHALKVQDSGSTTVHLHYIFSWNSCQLSKRYKLQPSCTHTYTRACSSLLLLDSTCLDHNTSNHWQLHTISLIQFHSLCMVMSSCPIQDSLTFFYFLSHHFVLFCCCCLFSILKVSWHGPTQICAEAGNCDWPRHTQTLARLQHVPTSARPWPLSSDSTNKSVDGEGEGKQCCSSQSYVDEELVLLCVEVLDVSAQDKAFCRSNLGSWQTLKHKHLMYSSC